MRSRDPTPREEFLVLLNMVCRMHQLFLVSIALWVPDASPFGLHVDVAHLFFENKRKLLGQNMNRPNFLFSQISQTKENPEATTEFEVQLPSPAEIFRCRRHREHR